jgi:hypothetical protein
MFRDELSYSLGPTVSKMIILMVILAFFVHIFACFFWRVKVRFFFSFRPQYHFYHVCERLRHVSVCSSTLIHRRISSRSSTPAISTPASVLAAQIIIS